MRLSSFDLTSRISTTTPLSAPGTVKGVFCEKSVNKKHLGWQWQGGSNYGRIKASPHNKSSNKASNAFDSKGTTFWHSQGRNSWFEVNFTERVEAF